METELFFTGTISLSLLSILAPTWPCLCFSFVSNIAQKSSMSTCNHQSSQFPLPRIRRFASENVYDRLSWATQGPPETSFKQKKTALKRIPVTRKWACTVNIYQYVYLCKVEPTRENQSKKSLTCVLCPYVHYLCHPLIYSGVSGLIYCRRLYA